jgi:hypothetical protein
MGSESSVVQLIWVRGIWRDYGDDEIMRMGLDGWRIASFSLRDGWVQRRHEMQPFGNELTGSLVPPSVIWFARRMRHPIQGCFAARMELKTGDQPIRLCCGRPNPSIAAPLPCGKVPLMWDLARGVDMGCGFVIVTWLGREGKRLSLLTGRRVLCYLNFFGELRERFLN